MLCRNCGTLIDLDGIRCASCGAQQSPFGTTCNTCGAALAVSQQRCPTCEALLPDPNFRRNPNDSLDMLLTGQSVTCQRPFPLPDTVVASCEETAPLMTADADDTTESFEATAPLASAVLAPTTSPTVVPINTLDRSRTEAPDEHARPRRTRTNAPKQESKQLRILKIAVAILAALVVVLVALLAFTLMHTTGEETQNVEENQNQEAVAPNPAEDESTNITGDASNTYEADEPSFEDDTDEPQTDTEATDIYSETSSRDYGAMTFDEEAPEYGNSDEYEEEYGNSSAADKSPTTDEEAEREEGEQ